MKVYGIIYLLIDGTNDKEYVGQTTRTFEERFYQHKHGDQYIDRVIQKHGKDLFTTAILKICYRISHNFTLNPIPALSSSPSLPG